LKLASPASGELDIFTSWALRTLALLECDGLTFPKIVEGDLVARRLVEKVLMAIAGCDEPEALVSHNFLDGAIHD
jgi:hypothetical protein